MTRMPQAIPATIFFRLYKLIKVRHLVVLSLSLASVVAGVCAHWSTLNTALATDSFGIVLTPLTTAFNGHAGIEHHPSANKLLVTAHGPAGQPHNFELIVADGAHAAFSNVAGLSGELRLAVARDDGQGTSRGGFAPGEIFTGTGAPDVVARISADGAAVQHPWVTLPGETGLLNGGLYVDRTDWVLRQKTQIWCLSLTLVPT